MICLTIVPFPLKYVVPNAFTALSLLLGLASVACSAKGEYELAAWMVLWGTLLDKADGSAARLLGATSKFGVEFDSFADFVSFGVAPAALFYFRLTAPGAPAVSHAALALTAGLYVVALGIRLSRFNITTGGESVFYGTPGTLMGAILASGFLTIRKYHLPEDLLAYAPAALLASSLLMVSTLRLPKLKMGRNKALNAILIANFAAAYVLGPLRMFPEYLFCVALLYMVGGMIGCALQPAEKTPEPESEPTPEHGDGHEDAA